MMSFIYEALKTAGALVLVAFMLVVYLLLAGCASIEGSGFINTGVDQRPVTCKEVKPRFVRCSSV